ncbi:MAG: hypothetical protein LBJ38_02090 [Oscillospiraceae bacterium]|nr:hypothetical protein [Oscillospiraceae bacterium]
MRQKKVLLVFLSLVIAITSCCARPLAVAAVPAKENSTNQAYGALGAIGALLTVLIDPKAENAEKAVPAGGKSCPYGLQVLRSCADKTWRPPSKEKARSDMVAATKWLADLEESYDANIQRTLERCAGSAASIDLTRDEKSTTLVVDDGQNDPIRYVREAGKPSRFLLLCDPNGNQYVRVWYDHEPALVSWGDYGMSYAIAEGAHCGDSISNPAALLAALWARNGWCGSISGPYTSQRPAAVRKAVDYSLQRHHLRGYEGKFAGLTDGDWPIVAPLSVGESAPTEGMCYGFVNEAGEWQVTQDAELAEAAGVRVGWYLDDENVVRHVPTPWAVDDLP